MHIRINKFTTLSRTTLCEIFHGLPQETTSLDLSKNTLGTMSGLDLMDAFDCLPQKITTLNLSNNSFSEQDIQNLRYYFAENWPQLTVKYGSSPASRSPSPIHKPAKRNNYHIGLREESQTRPNTKRFTPSDYDQSLAQKGYTPEQIKRLAVNHEKMHRKKILEVHESLMECIGEDRQERAREDLVIITTRNQANLKRLREHYDNLKKEGFSPESIITMFIRYETKNIKAMLDNYSALIKAGVSPTNIMATASQKYGDILIAKMLRTNSIPDSTPATEQESLAWPPNQTASPGSIGSISAYQLLTEPGPLFPELIELAPVLLFVPTFPALSDELEDEDDNPVFSPLFSDESSTEFSSEILKDDEYLLSSTKSGNSYLKPNPFSFFSTETQSEETDNNYYFDPEF